MTELGKFQPSSSPAHLKRVPKLISATWRIHLKISHPHHPWKLTKLSQWRSQETKQRHNSGGGHNQGCNQVDINSYQHKYFIRCIAKYSCLTPMPECETDGDGFP